MVNAQSGVVMSRDEALAALRKNAAEIRALGATALYLFGSAARDEISADSDVDLFIDYEQDGSLDYFKLCRIEDLVGSALGRAVDLTTRAGLHPLLRDRIVKSSIRVL